jgi:hypothetical protein
MQGPGKAVIPRQPQRGVVVNVAWSWQLRLSRDYGMAAVPLAITIGRCIYASTDML